MLGITKKTSYKNTGLVSRANKDNGSGKLSAELLDYLERKYKLLPWEMISLRVVKSKGLLGKLSVRFIRVYDKEMSEKNGYCIKAYSDLDNRPNLILYSGYIFTNGFVYLTKYEDSVISQNS